MSESRMGQLILVPTPIGNLGDMTLRGLEALREADVVACEDTRRTRILLDHFEIKKPVVACHEHNERQMAERLIDRVEDGERVCVVSDAGMPGISDPGEVLLREAIRRGCSYTVLPGASAAPVAYVCSGIGDGRFAFYGFFPRKGSERERILKEVDASPVSVVFYEAPHRIRRTLRELSERWPEREFCACRELTKQYEEFVRWRGADFDVEAIEERGEFAVVVGPGEIREVTDEEIVRRLRELSEEGISDRDAVRMVTAETGRSRNDIYRLRLDAGRKGEE